MILMTTPRKSHGIDIKLTIMTQLWPNYDPIMTPLWPHYDPIMTKIWPNYDPIMTQLWPNYDLIQHLQAPLGFLPGWSRPAPGNQQSDYHILSSWKWHGTIFVLIFYDYQQHYLFRLFYGQTQPRKRKRTFSVLFPLWFEAKITARNLPIKMVQSTKSRIWSSS